jgi:regulator of protease activity HflC (stomatin/prohibitin superfamily)
MADIRRFGLLTFGLLRHLRADAGVHVMRFRNGRLVKSGRGLAFWFVPHRGSIAELPIDDRMVLFFKGRSKDFQAVTVQGNLTWRVADPDVLGLRIDFSIDLKTGRYTGKPVEQIEGLLTGMSQQLATQYFAQSTVHDLLDAGIEPLRVRLEQGLAGSERLAAMGIEIVAIRLSAIAPRRALAVEKERAIAENELHNKTELARQEQDLIAQEAANGRNRAEAAREALQIAADGEASRIRAVEQASADMEHARIAIYRDLPQHVLLGLAARAFAEKLTKVDHLNVTPDMLASVLGELGRSPRLAAGDAGRGVGEGS